MRFCNFCILILFLFIAFRVSAQKNLQISRIDYPIKVDGILNEPGWLNAEKAVDFVQRSPVPGAIASYRSEVSVLYNDGYIYIGAWLFDDEPNKILKELTGRDQGGNADRFTVYFDTYQDGLNAFEFSVSASGVQMDARISPGRFDRNWDGGWYSEVTSDDKGWYVEIEIPLSVLRFPASEKQTWGLNFRRVVQRTNEQVYWNEVNPRISGFVNQFGTLSGIVGIKTPLRLSITPYISAYINKHSNPDASLNSTATSIRGGMDLKYGINDAFTLDMMLVPDFGQVLSDNNVLNLGPYEVYNAERRQFFTEGTDLFNKAGLLYSRRIGGRPIDHNRVSDDLKEGEEVVENPTETRIINAAKLSGRTNSGLGIGLLNSVTNQTFAIVKDSLNNERKILTSPYTNYNVLVFDQSLKNNSYINFTNTNVTRGSGYYDANATGTTFKFADKENNYAVGGTGVVSHLYGYQNMDPDTGYRTEIWAGKTSGNLLFNVRHMIESHNYNINDIGFLRAPNDHNASLNVEYREYEPFGKFLNFSTDFEVDYIRQYRPNVFSGINLGTSVRATFTNFLSTRIWLDYSPVERKDFDETRNPDIFLYQPKYGGGGFSVNTDGRKKFRVSGHMSYWNSAEKDRNSVSFSLSPRLRINDQLSLSTSLSGSNSNNNVGFVSNEGDKLNFGIRDIRSITNVLTTKYTFSKNMDLFFRMRHYWSSAQYHEFRELGDNGYLMETDYRGDHDVNYTSFNIDMVYTWIFSPASELSLVWKSSAINSNDLVSYDYASNVMDTFDAPTNNSISFKVLYYLDYLMLTRNRKNS